MEQPGNIDRDTVLQLVEEWASYPPEVKVTTLIMTTVEAFPYMNKTRKAYVIAFAVVVGFAIGGVISASAQLPGAWTFALGATFGLGLGVVVGKLLK